MSPEYVRRSGPVYGFRPWHLIAGMVVFVAWFGVLGFVGVCLRTVYHYLAKTQKEEEGKPWTRRPR